MNQLRGLQQQKLDLLTASLIQVESVLKGHNTNLD
jgi:hypothetical protein